MTAWICGTVAVGALAIAWSISSQPEPLDPFDPYSVCEREDVKDRVDCRAEIARKRIMAM